jgi:hypothetical protein
MSRRVITPFSDGPSKSFLEQLTDESSQINESLSGDSVSRKSKNRRRRSRMKSTSEDDGRRDSQTDDGRRERKMDRQISVSSEKSVFSDEEDERPVVVCPCMWRYKHCYTSFMLLTCCMLCKLHYLSLYAHYDRFFTRYDRLFACYNTLLA